MVWSKLYWQISHYGHTLFSDPIPLQISWTCNERSQPSRHQSPNTVHILWVYLLPSILILDDLVLAFDDPRHGGVNPHSFLPAHRALPLQELMPSKVVILSSPKLISSGFTSRSSWLKSDWHPQLFGARKRERDIPVGIFLSCLSTLPTRTKPSYAFHEETVQVITQTKRTYHINITFFYQKSHSFLYVIPSWQFQYHYSRFTAHLTWCPVSGMSCSKHGDLASNMIHNQV